MALEDDESGGYEIVKVEIPAEGGAGAISVEEYHPSKQQAIASIIDSTQRDSNVVSGPQTEQIQVRLLCRCYELVSYLYWLFRQQ